MLLFLLLLLLRSNLQGYFQSVEGRGNAGSRVWREWGRASRWGGCCWGTQRQETENQLCLQTYDVVLIWIPKISRKWPRPHKIQSLSGECVMMRSSQRLHFSQMAVTSTVDDDLEELFGCDMRAYERFECVRLSPACTASNSPACTASTLASCPMVR